MFLVNIPDTTQKLTTAIKWHDFAILKILCVFTVIFFYKNIISILEDIYFWILDSIPELPKAPIHGPQYFGIPISELVDYIFSAPSYSRAEFCEQFAVSRKVFDDLASGFDTIGVFSRGANNARVLSLEYSRADIASILTRASEVGEIRPLIRKTEYGYTHSPSHGFTTRPLHSSNPL